MSAFGDAFKAARSAGKSTFTYNGKSYTTQTKEDAQKASSAPASSPRPRARPSEGASTSGPSKRPGYTGPTARSARATPARPRRRAPASAVQAGAPDTSPRPTPRGSKSDDYFNRGSRGRRTRRSRPPIRG